MDISNVKQNKVYTNNCTKKLKHRLYVHLLVSEPLRRGTTCISIESFLDTCVQEIVSANLSYALLVTAPAGVVPNEENRTVWSPKL